MMIAMDGVNEHIDGDFCSLSQDLVKAFPHSAQKPSLDNRCVEPRSSSDQMSHESDKLKIQLSLQKPSENCTAEITADSQVFLLRLMDLNLGDEEGSRDAKSFYGGDSENSSGAVVRRPVFMKDDGDLERAKHVESEKFDEAEDSDCSDDGEIFLDNKFDDDTLEKNLRDLPEDLLQLCFARVPYRYHPRLRAVCRQWYSLAEGQRLLQLRKDAGKTEIWTFIMENEYDYYRKYLGLRGHAYHLFKDGKKAPPPHAPYGCIMWVGDRPYVAPFEGGHPIPRLHTPLRLEFGVAGASGKVYVLGGRPPLNGWHTGFSKPDAWEVYARVDVYCPASDSWHQVRHMPMPRYGFACAGFIDPLTKKAKVIVAGGYGSDEGPLSSADLYDPSTDTWQMLPEMTTLRGSCRGQIVDNMFLVKQVNGGQCLEAFDFSSRTWTPIPDHGQVDLDPLHLGDTNNNRSRSFASLDV